MIPWAHLLTVQPFRNVNNARHDKKSPSICHWAQLSAWNATYIGVESYRKADMDVVNWRGVEGKKVLQDHHG